MNVENCCYSQFFFLNDMRPCRCYRDAKQSLSSVTRNSYSLNRTPGCVKFFIASAGDFWEKIFSEWVNFICRSVFFFFFSRNLFLLILLGKNKYLIKSLLYLRAFAFFFALLSPIILLVRKFLVKFASKF